MTGQGDRKRMKGLLAVLGLAVFLAGCQRAAAEKEGSSLSTLHFVTSLQADDNEKLRDMLGATMVAAPDDAPSVLLVGSELSSPAFNFHIRADCGIALSYVEGLLTRAEAMGNLPGPMPDLQCVEVGQPG
jgi:hypothetical protein